MASQDSLHTFNVGWQQHPAVVQWQLDAADLILDIEHNLRGEFCIIDTDADGKKTYKPGGEVLMSDKGIKTMSTIIRSKVNKNTILSNLDENDVLRIADENRRNIADQLLLRYRDWNVKKSNFDTILQMIDVMVFMALKRAWKAGERASLTEMQRIESKTIDDRGSKPGVGIGMPWIFGDKK